MPSISQVRQMPESVHQQVLDGVIGEVLSAIAVLQGVDRLKGADNQAVRLEKAAEYAWSAMNWSCAPGFDHVTNRLNCLYASINGVLKYVYPYGVDEEAQTQVTKIITSLERIFNQLNQLV